MTELTKAQEGSLRLRLSMMCMAATAGKEGDLNLATESTLDYIQELIEPYSSLVIDALKEEIERQKAKTEYEAERGGNIENDLDEARQQIASMRAALKAVLDWYGEPDEDEASPCMIQARRAIGCTARTSGEG